MPIETHNFPDIVCIVESWLGHDVRDQEIAIPNYNIFRHDRNRHGGGILIYVKDSYITSVLPGAPPDLEIITICVQSGNCKACLSLFYRPPSSSSVIFDTFCKYLESLNTVQFSNFILLGDFNINFVNPSHPLYSKLCNIMSTYCLTQIVSECTHVHHNGSTSIIDLVFLSNPASLLSCVTVPPLSNSDHNGLLTTMKWKGILLAESTPADVPFGGMLMLIGRKHVSLLTTQIGTHCVLMISICLGLTGNSSYN